jgi:hypothetical protein
MLVTDSPSARRPGAMRIMSLEMTGEGLTNRQIGERMFLAGTAVKNYASAPFAKPWSASLINRLAPIWEQGTDVGSIKGRYPSDPAPGLGKRAGDRVAPGLSGTVG